MFDSLVNIGRNRVRNLAGVVLVVAALATRAQSLDASRAVWRAAAITNYEYSYQRVCECHPEQPADTIVTVRDGAVVGVRYARPGYSEQVALTEEKLTWFRTIDDLFSLVESAEASAATVRVSFDAQLGYPRSIFIDYDTDLVGEEVELAVTRFDPVD